MRPTTRPPSTTRRLVAAVAAGLVLAAGAAGCSSGDEGASSSADGGSADLAAPETLTEENAGAPAPADRDVATAGQDSTAVAASVTDRKLARRATVELEVTDIVRAAARLRSVAAAAGGLVVAEQVSSDPGEPVGTGSDEDAATSTTRPGGWGTVTISVPTEKLDTTLDQVAELGTVRSRSTSTDDVTGQYVDTASRVKSAQASVERVRALMSRATKLADVVSLEAELSRRQADLEAMQQQLASLDDRVALSPITVQLSTTGVTPPGTEDPTGFVAGLASGWAAFTTSVRLVLTLVGALLPFAVAGALVVVPLLLWWRRRPRTVTAGAPSTPSTPTA